MSEEMIIQYCSPTLAGLKTGNMFTCAFENEEALRNTVREFNRRYSHKGICLLSLRFRNSKALIYTYRPAHLARDLKHETARDILKNNGYNPDLPGRCISCLRKKLMNCDSFPAESKNSALLRLNFIFLPFFRRCFMSADAVLYTASFLSFKTRNKASPCP